LLPRKYFVDQNHELAFVTPDNTDFVKKLEFGSVAQAAEPPKYTYAGKWTVRDTHDAKYYTTFVVDDALGRENSVTIAWLDPCTGINSGGDATLGDNCAVSTVDGVDNGNFSLGGHTLTLNSGATFVWNPGHSVTFSSGGYLVIAGGQLVKGYLWMIDADADGYPATSTQYCSTVGFSVSGCTQEADSSTSPVSNSLRRYLENSALTLDCYDLNASAYPGQTAYFTTTRGTSAQGNDAGGNTWNSYDYDCDGTSDPEYPSLGSCATCTGVKICSISSSGAAGWVGSTVPACGASATYVSDPGSCTEAPPCSSPSPDCQSAATTQACN
jgi:hypothetical protein